jgi:hypothetical protein
MIHFKLLKGATPVIGDLLCETCTHAQIMRGENNELKVHCGWMNRQIHFKVTECSHYYRIGTVTLRDMKDTAWILEPSSRKTTMGFFVKPSEWRKANPDRDLLEDLPPVPRGD